MVQLRRLQNTPFVVDHFWKSLRAAYSFQPMFFLTHFHADHVSGMCDGWEAGPVYCTGVTRALLLAKFRGLDPGIVVRESLVSAFGRGRSSPLAVPSRESWRVARQRTPCPPSHPVYTSPCHPA
jgi:hypothetical protein